jgi:5-methyltetrahydrofolate--homocysteine methyltransferase
MNSQLKRIRDAVIAGKRNQAAALTQEALHAGLPPGRIMTESLIAAMDVVGHKYAAGEFFLPEMMVAAHAMEEVLPLLRPHLVQSNYEMKGKVVVGTVHGDIHDIGKNIVKMMMEGAGYEVIDLGVDVAAAAFVEAVRKESPKFVLMSSLITLTMESMKKTIEAIKTAGLRDKVLIGVGGAPVTQKFADQIGADFYADDAHGCVLNCNRLNHG